MKKKYYLAVFHPEDGGYWEDFPDLPGWLDDIAQEHKVNYSQTLQEALVQKLDL